MRGRAGFDMAYAPPQIAGSRLLYFNLDRLDVADHVVSAMPLAPHWLRIAAGISRPRHYGVTSYTRRCPPLVSPQAPTNPGGGPSSCAVSHAHPPSVLTSTSVTVDSPVHAAPWIR